MNRPKFNSKNRIFLICTCGKPENPIWEMYDKNTPKAAPVSEECPWAERRHALWLLPKGFKHLPLLPPHSLTCIHRRGAEASPREPEPVLPSEEKQEQETRESYSLGSQRDIACPSCTPLPVYIFIASQIQFTGSPRDKCQVGKCDWVKTSERWPAWTHWSNQGDSSPGLQCPDHPRYQPTGMPCPVPSQPGQQREPVISQCHLIKGQRGAQQWLSRGKSKQDSYLN